ncbi:MAG: SRPBCC family protein [Bryobacteraceae bacterium]
MKTGTSLIAGAALGAGLMYLADPARGRRRRAMVRDKARSLLNQTRDMIGKTSRDLSNRAHGLNAGWKHAFDDGEAPDDIVAARVRSKIGRLVTHPSAIEVTAEGGVVTLHGPVLEREVEELLDGVAGVPGVRGVESRLEPHEQPGDVPGLQGGPPRPPRELPELMQTNWTPAVRFLAGVKGGLLAVYGIRKRDLTGAVAGVLGAGLLARSLTNLEMRRMFGLCGRRAVDFHKTVQINAPVDEVFRFWSSYENFPRIMSHLKDVRDIGNGRSLWVAEGPSGVSAQWTAEITERVPNQVLAWKSVPGSRVANAGIIRFESKDGGTRLDIRISYNPPAGALGHAVASLFGKDPKHAMDEDLVRLKSLLEVGKTTAHGEKVTRGELPVSGSSSWSQG